MFSMVELGVEHPNTKGSLIGGRWGVFMKLLSITVKTQWREDKIKH
jgi:hypothetical protein